MNKYHSLMINNKDKVHLIISINFLMYLILNLIQLNNLKKVILMLIYINPKINYLIIMIINLNNY